MTRAGAAAGSFVFTLGEPGVMGVLVPYLITGWDGTGPPLALQVAGVALLAAGAAVLAHTVIRFAVEGLGTPFPGAPTENLVVGGLYRYVRNPMYLAVIAIILGQAAILGRLVLLAYAAIFWAVVSAFVMVYEEPTLSDRYGEQYDAYRRAVRRWWPRATPLKWPEGAAAHRELPVGSPRELRRLGAGGPRAERVRLRRRHRALLGPDRRGAEG